ncbi:MAG: NAD-dependent epimerase/dehydratase family protein [Actinomycetes bacterium]
MRILVTGATGFIGRSLVPALIAAGHDVAAGTRHPDAYRGPGRPVPVDLLDPPAMDRALDGCDAAYYLVHSMEAAGDFAARDRRAAVAFGDAARERAVRVVYLGGLGDLQGAAGSSEHLRSRHEVGQILRGAPTPWSCAPPS